ncbi:MAG TPA: cell division protein FtsQ/DivIB [Candidatus Omnitrophota bacterium]|nr:cell division protein FtsQ/DivIB [Candidatus Omnitrophota bacterium]
MAKQKRKMQLPGIFEGARDWLFRIVTNVAVLIIFIITVAMLVQAFLYRSDYFRVNAVEVRDAAIDTSTASYINNQLLRLYKGKNIFTVDLKAVSGALRVRFPDAKEVVVKIALPDKIIVSMKFRRAIALVRSGKIYPVDDEGIVLLNANEALFKFLPVIEGIEIQSSDRKAARGNAARNLRIAIDLIKEIKLCKFLSDYGVESVNARDVKMLSFALKNGVHVRIGFENFRSRLEALKKVIDDPRIVLDRIEYIDVRFKDVVIGPREASKS